jgi:glycosyltransferase involved in cell wall biosynthesis
LGEWAGFATFDRQLASLVYSRRPSAVIAYEMAALNTFRVAKRAGIVCILDAAACHYRLQDERLGVKGTEANSIPGRLIRVRKDEEVAMADLIICPSALSAESYVAAGVSAGKIVVNSLGVDNKAFAQSGHLVREGPPRFAFIANSAYVKGADLICTAIASLQAHHVHAVFDVVGAVRLKAQSDDCVQIVHHGHLSQSGVAEVLGMADCLLLPSRLESFGMVVLESLAAGVPVLVSKWAGSSMVIEENVTGWTFDSDPDEFTRKLLWCATHASEMRSMRQKCVETARRHSWDAYQARSVDIIGHAVNHQDMHLDAQK